MTTVISMSASSALPPVVDAEEWKRLLLEFREKEKAVTRQIDQLNAERRRLPMTQVDTDYVFEGETGTRSLLDLFDGRSQLIIYHFMFGADWEAGCPGCSWVTDAMSHPAHLHARDTSFAIASRAPIDKLVAYRTRMGWDFPWYSTGSSTFNVDMGATVDGEEHHGASVFLRDGDEVFRTYLTEDRGVEHLGSHWTWLDLTPYGRQEEWEVSPPGWPQQPAYDTRRHDEY